MCDQPMFIISQSLLILYFVYLVLSVVSNSPIITKSKELFASWNEEFPVPLMIQLTREGYNF